MPTSNAVPERIVLASDGGVAGQAAANWVADRARHHAVDVEIVTVEELDWLPVGADESIYQRKYVDVLAAVSKSLSNRHGVALQEPSLLAGEPASEIVDAAAGADLLVIGSPRRADDTGALHGTLALRIAAKISTRMAVVPAGWEAGEGSVVVGIDEDESSDAALQQAVSEALRAGRELIIVHAWSLPSPFSILDDLLGTTYPTLERIHRRILRDAAARASAIAPRLEVRTILGFGRPSALLASVARGESLLVVGHHHANRFQQFVLGSATHGVLLASPVPVIVVPVAPTS